MEDNRRTRKFNLIRDLITLAAQCITLIYAVIYIGFIITNKIQTNELCKIYIGICMVNTAFVLLYIINRKVSVFRVLITQLVETILIILVNVLAIYTLINLCNTHILTDTIFVIMILALVISVISMIISVVASTLFSLITVVHAN